MEEFINRQKNMSIEDDLYYTQVQIDLTRAELLRLTSTVRKEMDKLEAKLEQIKDKYDKQHLEK